jgi:5-methylcytosine-specific restriction protein A
MVARTEHGATHGQRRWKRRARGQRQAQPLCERCLRVFGRLRPAEIANHVEAFRGNLAAFWEGRLESLCKQCHDGAMQEAEKNGFDRTIGVDGLPIDKQNHPFYRGFVLEESMGKQREKIISGKSRRLRRYADRHRGSEHALE